MNPEEKSEYQLEKERLIYTRLYIHKILETVEQNEQTYKANIQEAMEDLDWVDSSLSYINVLTNTKFLEMNNDELRQLKAIESKPYFARMNFRREQAKKSESFYIGKTSLFRKDSHEPVIVDWRSPIANLYYEGRLGEVSYESQGETIRGYLSLKRQYTIDKGELLDYRDIDLTTRDDLLQNSLAGSSTNRLTEIVSTIQAEQNKVIRADMQKPLIVQGVAGSGKTTIALHRVSFFIYTFAKTFSPENLMILAPSRLFIDYISDVLPELGVDRVTQITFTDYVLKEISPSLKLVPDTKLSHLLAENDMDTENMKWASKIKGSLQFQKIVAAYVDKLETEFIPEVDFKVDRFTLYRAKKIKRLFQKEYTYLPFQQRLEKIKRVLQNQLKAKKKTILQRIDETYEDKIQDAIYNLNDKEKRRRRVTKLMDRQEEQKQMIIKKSRTAVKSYMAYFDKKNVLDYYKDLLADSVLIDSLTENPIPGDELTFLTNKSLEILNQNKIEMEDLAPLLYLQHCLFGLKTNYDIKNVVIDEAQDYSPFQIYSLKTVLNTNLFTILGDLGQGIHSYRGIQDWNEIIDPIFPQANYLTLNKSYRTTVEIMHLANQILSLIQLPDDIKAEPVVRHGKKPIFSSFSSLQDMADKVYREIETMKEEALETFAIIGRTKSECKQLQKLLNKKWGLDLLLLSEDVEIQGNDIVIVPAALAKGLEFDGVILVNLTDFYKLEEIDIKLLYVAMTRPLHRLVLLATAPSSFLIDYIPKHSTFISYIDEV